MTKDEALKAQPTKILGPNLEGTLNAAGFYRKKEWVGLTEEEATELWERIDDRDSWELIMQVQAKLKEKNSG